MTAVDVLLRLATRFGLGCLLFASTNIDDVFLLLALFSSPALRPAQIMLGQLLGMSVLLGASVVMARLAVAVAPGWVGLLGLFPLGLGVVQLVRRSRGADDDDAALRALSPAATSGWLGSAAVVGVTVANGGDNVGVYVPMFATARLFDLTVYLVTMLALSVALCWLVQRLMRHPRLGAQVRRYAAPATPFVLIALGLYILLDARVHTLLGP